MVDVKVEINEYAAFPTMVYKFKANLGADTHNQIATYIKVKKDMQTEDDLYKISFCLFSAVKYLLFISPMFVKIPANIAILSTDAAAIYSCPTNRLIMCSLKNNVDNAINIAIHTKISYKFCNLW